jgi:hypothetical protein
MHVIRTRAAALLLLALATACASRPPNRTLHVAPELGALSPTARTAWLGYGARLIYIFEQAQLPATAAPIVPTFEQEVEARKYLAALWRRIRVKDESPLDAYLEAFESAAAAGYVREYTWVYLLQHSWPTETPSGLKLAEFSGWATEHLPDHQGKTLVWVGDE